MARDITQIEKELEAIEESVETMAEQLQNTYLNYLELLGQTTQQQMILVCYQICTHTYPDAFLELSFSQCQQLQQKFRQLGKQTKKALISNLEEAKKPSSRHERKLLQEMLQQLPLTPDSRENKTPSPSFPGEEITFVPTDENEESLPSETEEILSESDFGNDSSEEEQEWDFSNPNDVAQWQEQLEDGIAQTLADVSGDANRLLQKAGILPKKIPAKLLEVAVHSDESVEAVSGPPNLMNLLIEAESKQTKESQITKVTVIRLRLPEIEFANPMVSVERNKIRELLIQVNQLRKQYEKKQREMAIAQAETAWRASWYEE